MIGASALVLWSSLAILTTESGKVPPFQLVAMAFSMGGVIAVAKWLWAGDDILSRLRQPAGAWLLGVGGLFGYHFCYFLALRIAPPLQASLVNSLWPLLIVLFSALLPGTEGLRPRHLLGAAAGLAGAALLVTGGDLSGAGFVPDYLPGYLVALACALIWSSYSVLNRRFRDVPSDVVGGFCAVTALLALVCHKLFETTVWPDGAGQWVAVLVMGLGPVGLAFFTWDYGVKHGNIRALGTLAYATPLMSSLLLILFGRAEFTWVAASAALLIVGGAALGTGDLFRRR